MVTTTKVTGSLIKPMEMAFMNIRKEQNFSEHGKTICKLAMVSKRGQTVQDMKVTMTTAKRTVLDTSNGWMAPLSSVSSMKTTSRDRDAIPGPMEGNMKANGNLTGCMAKEDSRGLMVDAMLASMSTTTSKASVSSSGQMGASTEDSGSKENNTARQPT